LSVPFITTVLNSFANKNTLPEKKNQHLFWQPYTNPKSSWWYNLLCTHSVEMTKFCQIH